MFRLKVALSIIIFLTLLTVTSIIKNQTRMIEKQLYKLNVNISLKEKDINESELDFYFLTSPLEIEKKVIKLSQNNYSPIINSKIFLSFSDFTNLQNKISVFKNQNEKKTQKN
jgi:hypothetical protein